LDRTNPESNPKSIFKKNGANQIINPRTIKICRDDQIILAPYNITIFLK